MLWSCCCVVWREGWICWQRSWESWSLSFRKRGRPEQATLTRLAGVRARLGVSTMIPRTLQGCIAGLALRFPTPATIPSAGHHPPAQHPSCTSPSFLSFTPLLSFRRAHSPRGLHSLLSSSHTGPTPRSSHPNPHNLSSAAIMSNVEPNNAALYSARKGSSSQILDNIVSGSNCMSFFSPQPRPAQVTQAMQDTC